MQPDRRAASRTPAMWLGGRGIAGLTSTPMRIALGTNSCRSPSRLVTTSAEKIDAGRVATRSGEAGDKTKLDRVVGTPKTIGIVAVAALAAIAASRTAWRSRPRGGGPSRPRVPVRDRIALQPVVFDRHVPALHVAGFAKPLAERDADGSAGPGSTNPTTGIAACCARATSGHAAALPSPAMNSRRFIGSPRRRWPAAFPGW